MSLGKRVRAQWERALEPAGEVARTVTAVPRVVDEKRSRDDIPRVVNVVTTFQLISQEKIRRGPCKGKRRFWLPQSALVMKFPAGQFSPKRFTAVILRVRDHATHVTALIFQSGKVVVVHTLSDAHALSASQMVRRIVGNVQVPVQDRYTGQIRLQLLRDHITFENRRLRNFVLSSHLGNRIDLHALAAAAPSIVSWEPDGFPGAEVTARIRSSDECTCKPSQRIKCGCKVKCLIFASGAIVITGATSVEDGNRVFYLFKSIAPRFNDLSAPERREQTYAKRLARMLAQVGEPATIRKKRGRKKGWKKRQQAASAASRPEERGEDENGWSDGDDAGEGEEAEEGEEDSSEAEDEEAMEMVLEHVLDLHHPDEVKSVTTGKTRTSITTPTPTQVPAPAPGTTPLMRAADQGQLQLVRDMLRMHMLQNVWATDAQGRTVVDRMEQLVRSGEATVAHREILNLLQTHVHRHPRRP